MKLHLQFKADTDDTAIKKVIHQAEAAGAEGVRPLFAESKQALLCKIYTVDVSSAATAEKLMDLLSSLEGVEHVEGEVKRSLR